MLLIETEECLGCEYFEEKNEIYMCNLSYVKNEFPYGVFNCYYTDVLNCKCKCQFFEKKRVENAGAEVENEKRN